MSATTVYLVRHGNTFGAGDIVRRVGRRTDMPLVAKGQTQALTLGVYFHGSGIRFNEVISSPLLRTMETAELICQETQTRAPIRSADFLLEIDYGADENQPEDDVVARLGRGAIEAWDSDCVLPDGWVLDLAQLRADWKKFFDLARTGDPRTILVVTSNGIARFALEHAAESDAVSGPGAKKLKTGAFGVFSVPAAGDITVEGWNLRPPS